MITEFLIRSNLWFEKGLSVIIDIISYHLDETVVAEPTPTNHIEKPLDMPKLVNTARLHVSCLVPMTLTMRSITQHYS